MHIGQLIDNRYRVTKIIGHGAFGETGIAIDTKFPGRPLRAVKQLSPNNDDPRALAIARRLFAEEAECLARLGEHDCIPRLFAYFEENEEFFLVQELIEGHDLRQEFQAGRKWSESETIEFLQELLSILAVVHQQDDDIVHRDLKPANIMRRDRDSKLVLIDFGAVKRTSVVDRNGEIKTIVDSTCIIGTPGYMSPEQAIGQPGKYSDIYAVGVLGIQALTGLTISELQLLPLNSESLQNVWQSLDTKVSDELKSILEKMIRFHYQQRYPNATAALEALALIRNSDRSPESITTFDRPRESHVQTTENIGEVVASESRTTVTVIEPETPTVPVVSHPSQSEAEPTVITKSFPKKLLFGTIAAVALTGVAGVYTFQAFNQPNYTQLETYLKNKQWEQADLETDKIILGIANEQNALDAEAIDKFPCQSLAKLDEFWTTNSDGQLGFTPQKEAFLATENEFDNYTQATYEAFGDLVKWRRFEAFVGYDDLMFYMPPSGHFPSPGKVSAEKKDLRTREREMLLSRFNECGL